MRPQRKRKQRPKKSDPNAFDVVSPQPEDTKRAPKRRPTFAEFVEEFSKKEVT